jgi:rhamnosyltransferase
MNVIAVIVTYESDVERLHTILRSLSRQCAFIIADNSITLAISQVIADCTHQYSGKYVSMGGNKGIAAAQNAAMSAAWSDGAEAVLLLDDDSMPDNNLVAHLLSCSESLGHAAIVGANALDAQGREIGNARHAPGNMPRCRDLMSSGTLIHRRIFERVGPFDDSLFIDCVDFDWGWRARQLGIEAYLCRATAMTHRLGEGRIAGLGYPSPIRHYFQYRNILRMMTRAYTPWGWRASQLLKLIAKLALIPLLMPDKVKRLRFAFAGIRDAFHGRSGPAPGSSHPNAPGLNVL